MEIAWFKSALYLSRRCLSVLNLVSSPSSFQYKLLASRLPRLILYIQRVPGGKVNILGGHGIGHSKKKVYVNMCPIPDGFRYLALSILNLARNIFLPSHGNAPLTEACESV
jgi:hypothetical protein